MKQVIRTLRPGEEMRHLELLNKCFGWWGGVDRWNRKYKEPGFDITRNVFVVEINGEWAGGRTLWFREAVLKNGARVLVSIAGDAYVLPEHRGKGIYSTLVRAFKKISKERGAVFNISFNAPLSVPGKALPKYGFVPLFVPSAILILNPSRYLNVTLNALEGSLIGREFEGLRLRIMVYSRDGVKISRSFLVKGGSLKSTREEPPYNVCVICSLEAFFRIYEFMVTKNRRLLALLIGDLLLGRLKVRLDMRAITAVVSWLWRR